MDSQKNNGMCRCCASEGTFKDVKTAYQWMGEEEVYADMLRECLDISLCADVTGDVEGGICEVCITQLRNASNFKKQVLHTEDQFKRRLQEGLFKSDIVKVEVPTVDEDSDNDNNLSEDFSGTEFEVPVKTESVEEPKAKKRTAKAKASTSRVKKMKAEDGETSKRSPSAPTSLPRIVKVETQDIKIKSEVLIVKSDIRIKHVILSEVDSWRWSVTELLANSNATPIRLHNGSGYKCCFCFKQFLNPADLKQHNTQLHVYDYKTFKVGYYSRFFVKMDITGLQCSICKQDIDNIGQLIEHLNNVHEKKVCVDIQKYIFPFKFDGDVLRCCNCSKSFKTFKVLQEHMHTHYSNYTCDVCSAGFVNKYSLGLHKNTHETHSLKCSQCDKTFDNVTKKKYHESMVHGQAKKNLCRICNERFKDFHTKEKHLFYAHNVGSLFRCQSCDKSFVTSNSLRAHVNRYHLMLKPHKCKECDISFYSSTQLRMHMTKHTGLRKFQCDFCSKSYKRRHTLKEHIRIHMNDRRHKCQICGQAFVQKCSLKGHMRSKHGAVIV